MEEYYCNFCKNKCPLSAPKCDNGRYAAQKLKENIAKDARVCKMCDKKCSYDNLECSTGKTMAVIKGWK